MKILIIDDEPGVLHIYGDKLTSEGLQATTASNGQEGLDKVKAEKPDLILLDVIMPKLNGLDVLKTLKQDSNTKDIPVILLTNLPAEMSAQKAKELGAADYLVKAEYDPSAVISVIHNHSQKQ